MRIHNSTSAFLRKALTANSVFSAISGAIMILAGKTLAAFLGLPARANLTVLGGSLLAYAFILFWSARREVISHAQVKVFVILDAAWVIGSFAAILSGLLSKSGNWTAGILADIVLLLAILQAYGLHRIRRAPTVRPTP
jgi:hypothetical protein